MDEKDRRSERRAFIKARHPDRGGDHAEFVAGLASYDSYGDVGPAAPPVRVTVHGRASLRTKLRRIVRRPAQQSRVR